MSHFWVVIHPSHGGPREASPLEKNKTPNRSKTRGGDSWGASLRASDGPHPTIFPSRGDPTAQGAQSWRLVGINVGKMRCSRKGRNDIETNCRPVGEPWSGKKSFRGLSEVNLTVAGRGEDTHLSSPAMSHFLLYFMLRMIHSTDYKRHSCVCVCAHLSKKN